MTSSILVKNDNIIKNKDQGCLGAAILAGVAIRLFESIKEACDLAISINESYYPDLKEKKYMITILTYLGSLIRF